VILLIVIRLKSLTLVNIELSGLLYLKRRMRSAYLKFSNIILKIIAKYLISLYIYTRKDYYNYSGGGVGSNERLGYIRLKAEEVSKWEPIPRWINFKPLDMDKECPGSCLMNLQFVLDSESNKRNFKQRGISKKYKLFAHIVQGFELIPKEGDDEIETIIRVEIDDEKSETQVVKGRYPFFNEVLNIEVELDWKLDFTPNVEITLFRKHKSKGLLSGTDLEELGMFSVPVRCIKKKKKYPHYFNFINKNEIVGRLMAMFYIKDISKAKKQLDRNETFEIHQVLNMTINAKVKVFVLGFRNLDFDATCNDFKFGIDVTKDGENPLKEIKDIKMYNKDDERENQLNIIETFYFDVKIHGDKSFLIFPMAKIFIKKEGILFFAKENYVVFNISEYCKDVEEKDFKLYRKLFEMNLGVIDIEQEQYILEDFKDLLEVKNNDEEDDEYIPQAEGKGKEINFDTLEDADVRDRLLVSQLTKYKNMIISDDIYLKCMHKDKTKERQTNKDLRKITNRELRDLQKRTVTTKDEIDKLLELQNKMKHLKKPLMSEDMFFGFDDISDEYDYGRDIYKEDVYENHPNLEYPYKVKKLHYIPWGPFSSKVENLGGYFKLGCETEGMIKYDVIVELEDDTSGGNTNSDIKDTAKETSPLVRKSIKHYGATDDELDKEIGLELKTYNIYNEMYLSKFKKVYYNKTNRMKLKKQEQILSLNGVKVRVYIYRCLNLTAQDDYAVLIDRIAGYSAFCRANAYLELMVGDKYDQVEGKQIKHITDKGGVVPNSLNPSFYKYFELDADLPDDWKLTINVLSQTDSGFDTLIGSTTIDLEDRYIGELINREAIRHKSLESHYIDFLKNSDLSKDETSLISKKINLINMRMENMKRLVIPVEFRPLYKPGVKVAQGIIEMFVEVLPGNLAKKIPPAKIEAPTPLDYELRLVIWETRNIPILGSKVKI
jgi:hypothetical protein